MNLVSARLKSSTPPIPHVHLWILPSVESNPVRLCKTVHPILSPCFFCEFIALPFTDSSGWSSTPLWSSLIASLRILAILQLFWSAETCSNISHANTWSNRALAHPPGRLPSGLNVRHQLFQSLGAYYLPQSLEQLSFFCENSHQVRLQPPLHDRKSRPSMRFDPVFNNHIPTFIRRFRTAKRTHSHPCIKPFSLRVTRLAVEQAPIEIDPVYLLVLVCFVALIFRICSQTLVLKSPSILPVFPRTTICPSSEQNFLISGIGGYCYFVNVSGGLVKLEA